MVKEHHFKPAIVRRRRLCGASHACVQQRKHGTYPEGAQCTFGVGSCRLRSRRFQGRSTARSQAEALTRHNTPDEFGIRRERDRREVARWAPPNRENGNMRPGAPQERDGDYRPREACTAPYTWTSASLSPSSSGEHVTAASAERSSREVIAPCASTCGCTSTPGTPRT